MGSIDGMPYFDPIRFMHTLNAIDPANTKKRREEWVEEVFPESGDAHREYAIEGHEDTELQSRNLTKLVKKLVQVEWLALQHLEQLENQIDHLIALNIDEHKEELEKLKAEILEEKTLQSERYDKAAERLDQLDDAIPALLREIRVAEIEIRKMRAHRAELLRDPEALAQNDLNIVSKTEEKNENERFYRSLFNEYFRKFAEQNTYISVLIPVFRDFTKDIDTIKQQLFEHLSPEDQAPVYAYLTQSNTASLLLDTHALFLIGQQEHCVDAIKEAVIAPHLDALLEAQERVFKKIFLEDQPESGSLKEIARTFKQATEHLSRMPAEATIPISPTGKVQVMKEENNQYSFLWDTEGGQVKIIIDGDPSKSSDEPYRIITIRPPPESSPPPEYRTE